MYAKARHYLFLMPLRIPEDELRFRTSRAGGPGGQHVNKTSTKVEVLWDVAGSPALSERQRTRLLEKLRSRIDSAGILRVSAGERRSQHQNREAAVERLHARVHRALKMPKPRKKTKPSAAAKRARLQEKRRRGELKKQRGSVDSNDA